MLKMRYVHIAMYRLKIKQIKLFVSKITGRLRFSQSSHPMDSLLSVSGSGDFSEPEDLRVFSRRKQMMGAYVSVNRGIPIKAATPHNALGMMKTYFTPILCTIYPLQTSPRADKIQIMIRNYQG
jgi:hypothetical protein